MGSKVTKDALVVYNSTVEVVTFMIERWDELFQVRRGVCFGRVGDLGGSGKWKANDI